MKEEKICIDFLRNIAKEYTFYSITQIVMKCLSVVLSLRPQSGFLTIRKKMELEIFGDILAAKTERRNEKKEG